MAILASRLVGEEAFIWLVNDELGPGENLTALLFLVAGLYAFRIASDAPAFGHHWVRPLFVLFGVVALFVTGEEISWGQHYFGWATPEWMAEINVQQETNLHNMLHGALDQQPRGVLSILILLGGAVVPILYARGKLRFLDRFPPIRWLMPPATLAVCAVLVFAPRIVDRIQVWFNVEMPEPFHIPTRQFQEIQELFISLFIVLYVINLVARLAILRRRRTH
ncbi:MAG: hypothetical protein ACFCVH_11465 [Alphaproteobacteria bacterium]